MDQITKKDKLVEVSKLLQKFNDFVTDSAHDQIENFGNDLDYLAAAFDVFINDELDERLENDD